MLENVPGGLSIIFLPRSSFPANGLLLRISQMKIMKYRGSPRSCWVTGGGLNTLHPDCCLTQVLGLSLLPLRTPFIFPNGMASKGVRMGLCSPHTHHIRSHPFRCWKHLQREPEKTWCQGFRTFQINNLSLVHPETKETRVHGLITLKWLAKKWISTHDNEPVTQLV